MSGMYVAPDAEGQPTVWFETDGSPVAILRYRDIQEPGRALLWSLIEREMA